MRWIARPVVAPGRCTGCGWCVAACPDHLLVLEAGADRRKSAHLAQPALCPGCGMCIPVCNFGAIKLARAAPAHGSAGPAETSSSGRTDDALPA